MPASEHQSPSDAGAKMLRTLGTMCPVLMPGTSPRGFPSDREQVMALCDTPAQRRDFEEALAMSIQDGMCPVCSKHAISKETAGLRATWSANFNTLEWKLQSVSTACLHCCAGSNVDEMLRAMLGVSDEGGEAAFRSLGRHCMRVNGMGEEEWEKFQAAVNTAHAIKTLASNMPFRVVDENGKAATQKMLVGMYMKALSSCAEVRDKRRGEKGAAEKQGMAKTKDRKSTGGAEEGAKRRLTGAEEGARRRGLSLGGEVSSGGRGKKQRKSLA